jgi:mRNA-degrading endonuclease toxin of MazEF toxin-antitoxin module
MVIRYAYLWRREHELGLEEGAKDRPCAVLLAVTDEAGDRKVIVLPVTHTLPRDLAFAVEIPATTKRRLGLDDQRSWILATEANRFTWPGPDLRPMKSGDATTVVYGELPAALFRQVQQKWLACSAARRSVVRRTE